MRQRHTLARQKSLLGFPSSEPILGSLLSSFYFLFYFEFIISPLVFCNCCSLGWYLLHADSLQRRRFKISQRNFIPFKEESKNFHGRTKEKNQTNCLIHSNLGFVLEIIALSFPLSTRCFTCVSVWARPVGVKLEGKKPRILCIIGPFLVALEWKGHHTNDYARQKRFILSLILLRGRLAFEVMFEF